MIENYLSLDATFSYIADELMERFPQLDLRFTIQPDMPEIHYCVADVSEQMFELSLDADNIEHVLHEAILNIKQVAGLFDA